jgi:hypothetical protein
LSLVVLAGLAAGLPAACRSEETVQDVLKIPKARVKGKPTIALFNRYGPVFVLSGRSLPPAVWGKLVRKATGEGKAEAKKKIGKLAVSKKEAGSQITYAVQAPNEKDFSGKLSMTVPVDSTIKVGNGDEKVTVLGVRGDVDIDSDGGKVLVRGMKGRVTVDNGDGDVLISGALKAFQVQNESGGIKATVRYGDELESDSVLRSDEGDIKLRIPETLNARLALRSGKGKIACNFPIKKTGSKTATATLGKGGKLISLETSGGQVRVLRLPMIRGPRYDAKGLPPVKGGSPVRVPKGDGGVRRPTLPGKNLQKPPRPYKPHWPKGHDHDHGGHDHDHGGHDHDHGGHDHGHEGNGHQGHDHGKGHDHRPRGTNKSRGRSGSSMTAKPRTR